jgi:UDP-N-acetylmuramate: L-alanyl-gamma-D-glutamyl-meso-diaminopimelate ligase
MRTLADLRHVHIVGVGGTLMGAFAAFLKRAGVRVTGSDGPIYPPMSDVLRDAGVETFTGYDAANLSKAGTPDLVVIGNVIRRDNPEARAAIDGKMDYTSLPEAMERFMLRETRNVVVAGTHGKTTTSSLMTHVLRTEGLQPSWFIGGVCHDLPHSFHVELGQPAGRPFVLEGDEYDTAFWDKVPKFNHYLPNDVILTSVEYDHADIYPNLAAVEKAFEGLLERIRPEGRLIACLDYESLRKLLHRAKVPVTTYASSASLGADYHPGAIKTEKGITTFTVMGPHGAEAEISLRIPGQHNVMNALAVYIEGRAWGIPAERIAAALLSFQGVKRRQEERGEKRGVLIIDDFAHHPTAVRETLKALKAKYPSRRLVSVFEPRSATSRRKVFQADYAAAFDDAAIAYIANAYDQSSIKADDQFSSAQLVDDMKVRGRDARLMPQDIDAAVAEVAQSSQKGDLIAVLSNGGFGGFIGKLLSSL